MSAAASLSELDGLDPGSVAACLGHGVPANVVRRLMTLPRFAPRVAALVDARMGALPASMEAAQSMALSLDRWAMQGLMMRVGAVWYARHIARKIDGASVRALVGAIGPELRNVALVHRELAPPLELVTIDPEDDEIQAIAEGLERQGIACVKAWSMRQPPPIALRMELRLPRRPMPADEHTELGPVIVESLLWSLAS